MRRPRFALVPGPGEESVWDYPRPPCLEPDRREVVIMAGAIEVARTRRAMRLLETASPPAFYLPPEDVAMTLLRPASGASHCEWKGEARYWSVVTAEARLERIAWSYPDPSSSYRAIAGWLAFYPVPLVCTVEGVVVERQPGGFYGGWVTPEVVGPFKGEPGTSGW